MGLFDDLIPGVSPEITRGSTFGWQQGIGSDPGDNGQFAFGGGSTNNPEDYAALPADSPVPPGYRFPVTNPDTGTTVWVTRRDVGPAKWTGRGVDLAPSAMQKLGAQTDQHLVVDTGKAFNPARPFDDLIPKAGKAGGGMFDDLIPKADNIPTAPLNVVTPTEATPTAPPNEGLLSYINRIAQTPSPAVLQPFEERARAFGAGAGIPSSLEEVKQFITRSPIQDIKDIAAGAAELPERVRNIGETLATSPGATVLRAPLSPEAFGVYGTAAGMLLPGIHERFKGARVEPAAPPPETVATPTVEAPAAPLEPPPVEGYARVAPPEAAPPAAAPPAEAAKPAAMAGEVPTIERQSETFTPAGVPTKGETYLLKQFDQTVGALEAYDTPEGLQVGNINVADNLRRRGLATQLYEKLLDDRGGFVSDNSVSQSAASVYDTLAARGHDVVKNPTAYLDPKSEMWRTTDGKPVFEVTKGGEVNAPQERQQPESRQPEYPGNGPPRAPAEAGGGGGVEPSAPVQAQEKVSGWFHGTHENIESFQPREVAGIDSIGTWFTGDKIKARELYGPKVVKADVTPRNLLEAHTDNFGDFFYSNKPLFQELFPDKPLSELESWKTQRGKPSPEQVQYLSAFRKLLTDAGYDGAIWKQSRIDLRKSDTPHDVAVIFHEKPIQTAGAGISGGGIGQVPQAEKGITQPIGRIGETRSQPDLGATPSGRGTAVSGAEVPAERGRIAQEAVGPPPPKPPPLPGEPPLPQPPDVGARQAALGPRYGIEPGKVSEPQDIINAARMRQVKGTGDPYAAATKVKAGQGINSPELADIVVEHERLANTAEALERQAETNPTPENQRAYEEARQHEEDFAINVVKPAGTAFGEYGRTLQQVAAPEPTTLTGIRQIAIDRLGRELKAAEGATAAKIKQKVTRDLAKADVRTRNAQAAADKLVKDRAPLSDVQMKTRFADLAKRVTPCK